MAQETPNHIWYVPTVTYAPPRVPRISGTAIFGGVHLSSGSYGTASPLRLFFSGLYLTLLLALGLVLTYLEAAALDQLTGLDLSGRLLGFALVGDSPWELVTVILLQALPMVNFLLVLRLSPLSGYHAAEHKTVTAIEQFGDVRWDQVVEMPRAHPRCGTVLLFGLLPAMLIAYPLLLVSPVAAVIIALAGWLVRYQVGYFIQQVFTTKPPTPAQMRAGMASGVRLLQLWRQDPDRRVSVAKNLWTRGLFQLLAGVLVGQYLLGWVIDHAHLWLDW